jgi:hypothetical protein
VPSQVPRIALSLLSALLSGPAVAQVTQRVSLDSAGVQGSGQSVAVSITPDGRYIGFHSHASNLVPGDTNGHWDVFVRDRRTGATERVSIDSSGIQGNGDSYGGWLSDDGRFVAFTSWASNLVPGDTNGAADAFVRDRLSGTTERVSLSSGGAQGNSASYGGPMTPDGRLVIIVTFATNLAPVSTHGYQWVLVHDRMSGSTELVSLSTSGVPGNNYSNGGTISADGRYVAFVSDANNLVPGDSNLSADIFVRDRQAGSTERVSVSSSGAQANAASSLSMISASGRYVAFDSLSTTLVPGDTNGARDVFVRDRQAGTTERVSLANGGSQGNGESFANSISADGRFVAFESAATNLVVGDSNGHVDSFIRDRANASTELVSLSSRWQQGNADSGGACTSADGRFIAYSSDSSNLVVEDSNGVEDVFVRDRLGGTRFTSLCEPGVAGVLACPCMNPPSGLGRGCDNSSATGGASLTASGGTFLSCDSLWFTTEGEKPSALSILSQWTGTNGSGLGFGMGVRCTAGTLKRLYTKSAIGGSITAPDLTVGDPQVSARSAALGDSILPGQSRWYVVYYRDSIVLGGCPASDTFNATQTGQVAWSP